MAKAALTRSGCATNKAASFDFNGDVALSAASTVIDTTVPSTAAGDITFAGDIFGLADGGQSLTLKAGPGTGAKSANGDIAMNNAGISTLRLGSLTVSGDDFTALTVDLAGNIGGHIVSGGNVNLTAAGAVSGNITGKVVSLTGQTVNSQVTANNFPNVNLQQLGVEGFALPVGTQIGANGQLILPAGTVLGLLSPGGGTPRVIMVQTVQELGALLDQGYVAIVIDLTGHKKATKVASN